MSELPYNLEYEQNTLGAFMICTDWLGDPDFEPALTPEDFYDWRNRIIFKAMLDLHARGRKADYAAVQEELARTGMLNRVGGKEYIFRLVGNVVHKTTPRGFDPCHYVPVVKALSLRRKAVITAQRLAQAALNYSQSFNENTITEILEVGHEYPIPAN